MERTLILRAVVRKRNLTNSSIFKKLLVYTLFEAECDQLRTQEKYGDTLATQLRARQRARHGGLVDNFRVLTITAKEPARVDTMIAARKHLHGPANTFLFTTLSALLTADNPLTYSWRNGRGDHVPIFSRI